MRVFSRHPWIPGTLKSDVEESVAFGLHFCGKTKARQIQIPNFNPIRASSSGENIIRLTAGVANEVSSDPEGAFAIHREPGFEGILKNLVASSRNEKIGELHFNHNFTTHFELSFGGNLSEI